MWEIGNVRQFVENSCCGHRAEISGDGEIFPPPGPATAGTDTSSPKPVPFVAPPSHQLSAITALRATEPKMFSGSKAPDPHARGEEVKLQDLIQRPGNTEPEVDEAVSGVGPVAVGRAAVPRAVDPGTAAPHVFITVPTLPGTPIPRRSPVVLVPAILHPFPYVARRIEQTESIRLETPHGGRTRVPSTAAPVAVRLVGADVVAPVVYCRASRPRHVFPFRLAQQPVGLARLTRQPAHVLLRILPGDIHHRSGPPGPSPSCPPADACSRRLPRTRPIRQTSLHTCRPRTEQQSSPHEQVFRR